MEFQVVDFAIWAAGAVIVTGSTQAIKKLWKRGPSWLWLIVTMAMSALAGYAYASSIGNSHSLIWHALGIFAVTQLFYRTIVKRLEAVIGVQSKK